jgi:hypothetical protein
MKKLIAVALAGLLAASMVGTSATAAKKKKKKKKAFVQTQEGSILLPAPFYNDLASCYAGLHRRSDTVSQGQENGVTGYHFNIDKRTWNKPFKLDVVGAEGPADLDMYFYVKYPGLDEWPNDPVNAGGPISVDFTTRKAGGEKGKVPPQTSKAIVCLYAGDPGTGPTYASQAAFKYVAGK